MSLNSFLEETPTAPVRTGRKSIAGRRCSIGIGSNPVGTPGEGTPFLDVPQNNDEEERRERQLSRLQKLQNSRQVCSSPVTSDHRKSISTLEPRLTGQQLSLHYAKCIQLSAENKISIKNAFNLQLIDYMTEMLRNKDSDMNNFQVASCTLDASTKIYAYRVDCVHTDTMRIAGGLGRTQQEKEQVGEHVTDLSQPEQLIIKRKRTKKTATIETNPNNLSLSTLELEFMVDPLFKKISSQFDEGRAGGGLFLNSLILKDDLCQLLLDSQAPSSDYSNTMLHHETVTIPLLPNLLTASVCPSFSSFHFNNWSINDMSFTDNGNNEKFDAEKLDASHAFDMNATPEPLEELDDPVVDFAMTDADTENCDEYDSIAGNVGGNNTVMTVGREGHHCKTLPTLETIHLKEHLASMPLEYSYFDSRVMSAWAGPGHWKLNPATKDRVICQEVNKEGVASKKRDTVTLDYTSLVERLSTLEQYFSVTKRMTKLSTNTIKQWSEDNTTLPVDLHFDPSEFAKLYGRIDMVVRRQLQNEQVMSDSMDDSIHEYNHDNDENLNYCPEAGNVVCDASGNDEMTMFSQTLLPPSQYDDKGGEFLGENLVAAPTRVAKLNIGYARTAKRMDMKKLKVTVWNILAETSHVDKENDLNGANKDNKDVYKHEMNKNTTVQFSNVFKCLPKHLTTNMAENLSFPLAFIAVLHLCNERNLALRPLGNMEDFTVMQG